MVSRRDIIICTIFCIAAILFPYGYAEAVGLGSPDTIIAGLFWEYVDSFYFTGFRLLAVGQVLTSAPFWLFRFIFLSMMIYYFAADSTITRIQIILVGTLSELIPLLVSLPNLMNFNGWTVPLYNYVIPIPILLLLGVVLMVAFPKMEPEGIWES